MNILSTLLILLKKPFSRKSEDASLGTDKANKGSSMTAETLGIALSHIQNELERLDSNVRIAGKGMGRFIVADRGRHSVEVAPTGDVGWWVEFWEMEPGSDDDGNVVGEQTVVSRDEAVELAANWLMSGKEPA